MIYCFCFCCSITKLCLIFCDAMNCSTPVFPGLHYLPGFAQTHVHWVDGAIQPPHPLLPPFSCPHSFLASGSFPMSWLFTSGGQSIGASSLVLPKNCFDLLPIQGALKSLLQHCSLKASILWHWAFFMVQFSHLYMITGAIITLTIWTFVSKVMSLLFNTLSLFVIAYLPRIKCLISWL